MRASLLRQALIAGVLLAAMLPVQASPCVRPDAVTPDGGRYCGPLRDGILHGQGVIEWDNGERYEGAFKDGRYHGRGKFSSPEGTYEGEFVRGRFHGKGRYVNASGDVYEGEFVDDVLTGAGRLVLKDGGRYEGGFLKWRYQGAGIFTTAQGEVYEGEFADGELSGRGRYVQKDGATYEGELKEWRPHGKGRLQLANGDVFDGGFAFGVYDGKGTLTYAKPQADGQTRQSGTWRYGVLDQPEERARLLANVESALYAQRQLLDRSLAALAPSDPKRINMYLLAIAGDGTQEVFRREVEFVRDQFARRFRTRGRTVVLANSRSTVKTLPMATLTSVRAALQTIASRMDREKDILFLFLTSHGSKEHELTLALAGMSLQGLSAARLGELLKESGIRWKVVVVSACYGGGFADAILDEHTMVIAAARRDRQSFGCADENDFTYFGRAYFKEALPKSLSFHEAFRKAEALVKEWELKDAGVRHAQSGPGAKAEDQLSLPQLHSAEAIDKHLRRWWAQFR